MNIMALFMFCLNSSCVWLLVILCFTKNTVCLGYLNNRTQLSNINGDEMVTYKRMISSNSAPIFTTGLTAVIVKECASSTYSFPSVTDNENDSYTITVPSLDSGAAVPSWIVYNVGSLNINPPINTVTSGDLKQFKLLVLLTDSLGASNTYYLTIGVQHTAVPTKNLDISDLSVSSPNNATILLENYLSSIALNCSLALYSVDTGSNLPTWISLVNKTITIDGYTSSDFGKYQFYVVATNLCGQSYTTNTFLVVLSPNYPPK